jgi:hypothetical protein
MEVLFNSSLSVVVRNDLSYSSPNSPDDQKCSVNARKGMSARSTSS